MALVSVLLGLGVATCEGGAGQQSAQRLGWKSGRCASASVTMWEPKLSFLTCRPIVTATGRPPASMTARPADRSVAPVV